MKNIRTFRYLIIMLLTGMLLIPTIAMAKRNGKVTICHIPDGNPENASTIKISKNALNAHLAHGDKLGQCGEDPITPTNTPLPPTPTFTPILPTATFTPLPPTPTFTPVLPTSTFTPFPPGPTDTATTTPFPPGPTDTATPTPFPPGPTNTATPTPLP